MNDLLNKIQEKTKKVFEFWKHESYGWAPCSSAIKIEAARLDWLSDLTDCLEIWLNKSLLLTDGELLLARANLGALVEGWLKLFYCVYYEDYLRAPIKNKKGKIIEPNLMDFEELRIFSQSKVWNKDSDWGNWVYSVQKKRNAIHAFNDRDIGTAMDFIDDVEKYYEFINLVDDRFPYP